MRGVGRILGDCRLPGTTECSSKHGYGWAYQKLRFHKRESQVWRSTCRCPSLLLFSRKILRTPFSQLVLTYCGSMLYEISLRTLTANVPR